MNTLFAIVIGILIGVGVYMLLSRTIIQVVVGLAFIGYGINLITLTVAGLSMASPPLLTLKGPYADPLPQALILTAIVIGFATTALLLTVALRAFQVAGQVDARAFDDNLAREANTDNERADPEHQSPDHPDWEETNEGEALGEPLPITEVAALSAEEIEAVQAVTQPSNTHEQTETEGVSK